MNGGSPLGSRFPLAASPTGSNNTANTITGRPPLWTESSQRKVSRLYLYTTLPIQKIIEVIHSKSPETAPGKESAHKRLNALLDKEPRWLRPRAESDMGRRLNELSLSPTRSLSSRGSSPRRHAASDPPRYLHPGPNAMKREAGTSPTCLEVPAFHQPRAPSQHTPAAAAPTFAPTPTMRQQPNTIDKNPHTLDAFLRRTTFMSNSTQGTQRSTGSIQRVLAGYSEPYIRTVKRLVKRYTAPLGQQLDCRSPASDMGFSSPSWLNDEDAPSELLGQPHFLPGHTLNFTELIRSQGTSCFPLAEDHKRRACLCFVKSEIKYSPFEDMQSRIPLDSIADLDNWNLTLCDAFNNTVLHYFADRLPITHLEKLLETGRFDHLLNARNTAGQTFLHVLNPIGYERLCADPIHGVLGLAAKRNCDIYVRDVYGRTIFHLILDSNPDRDQFKDLLFCTNPENLKRDAFNIVPGIAPDVSIGINHVSTQRMDLDPMPDPYYLFPHAEDPMAPVAAEAEILRVINAATTDPRVEHANGGNGLHCLAAATLSQASLGKKYGLSVPMPGNRDDKNKEAKKSDSSSERMNLRLGTVISLLQAGVDPNHYDNNGNTPLMAFTAMLPEDVDYKAGPEILTALIQAGADVNARNRRGETALHIAVRCGRKLAVRTLVQHSANVHVRDSDGRSLLQVTDVKIQRCTLSTAEYAHLEACRAWLSGKGRAVQEPSLVQEWEPVIRPSF